MSLTPASADPSHDPPMAPTDVSASAWPSTSLMCWPATATRLTAADDLVWLQLALFRLIYQEKSASNGALDNRIPDRESNPAVPTA